MTRHLHPRRIDGDLIVTSDLHLFHNNIILYDNRSAFMTGEDSALYQEYVALGAKPRGRRVSDQAVESMNETILGNINASVKDPDRDTVLIVGDFVFGGDGSYRAHAEYARRAIRCRDVRLVLGNHDKAEKLHDLFTFCFEQGPFTAGGRRFYANHRPMLSWDASHRGSILLYGHVHGLYSRPGIPHPLARPGHWAALDVGTMNFGFRPVTVPQIVRLVQPALDEQQRLRDLGCEHHLF